MSNRCPRAFRKSLLICLFLVLLSGCNDNGPPHAVNDAVSVEPGTSVTIDVLENDTDPDGDRLELGEISQPQIGMANVDGLMIVYTAEEEITGTDEFTYAVTDGRGGVDSATVTVSIGMDDPFNDSPIAVDDQDATRENTPMTTRNVLENDSDPDGDALIIEDFTQPDHGAIEDNQDGTFYFTPEVDWYGDTTFTYTISDGRGGRDSATVTITVAGVGFDLYVALDGDDEASGTVDQPLATLEGARDLLRRMREEDGGLPEGGVIVWIREGIYERASPFTLTEEDSGDFFAQVTYSAYPGDEVRISGGISINALSISDVTEATEPDIWARLDAAARGNVVQVDLATHITEDYGELTDRGFGFWSGGPAALELFIDQLPMQLARWPDADEAFPFATVVAAIDDVSFTYDGDRPDRWGSASDVWFHGYWMHMWADKHMSAGSIDTSSQTITLTDIPGYGIADDQPYYALNLLEEITVPGEWYLDRGTGILYLWPPSALEEAEIVVSLMESPLLELSGASYITVADITFEAGRAELIRIDGGQDNLIERCTLRNAGLEGAIVDGQNNGLNRCEIAETGNGGVRLSGGDRPGLSRARNFVRNCHIHDFSRWTWTYTPGVYLDGVGFEISHNLIHDAPHTAILFRGNEHFIDYNEIYDVCIWSSDAGAIYSGRDWGFRGNRVQYNFIHHIDSNFEGYGTHGIYLDDCVSGIRVYGNVLYEISGNAIQHGGGRDDLMENNVIARCGVALAADSRGISRIVNDGSDWDLLQKIIDMDYQSEPWSTTYPELAAIPNSWGEVSAADATWLYPEGSVFSRNVCFANDEYMTSVDYGGTGTFDKYAEIAENLEDVDPLFVDEENLDLTLSTESPAYDIPDFVTIPFNQIGIEPEDD